MATGQSQVSSDSVEKTKQQIRGLVGEIAQLSKSDLEGEEFFAAFLQKVVQALAAVGGAVWVIGEGKKPQLAYQINLSPNLLDKESEQADKHYRLLEYVTASNAGQLVSPNSGSGDERMGSNPTRHLMVVHPMGHDNQVEGLLEIFQRPDTAPATQRGYLQFAKQMCELSAEWFKNRKLRHFSDRHTLWAQADQFSRAVHQSLDVRETCYTVVNEGRRLMGCDRVSIAIQKGSRYVIESVSGQDTLDSRSNVVTLLGNLATRVIKSGEPLWYAGSTEDMPPQIEEAIEGYVDQSYTKSLAVIPLRKPQIENAAPQPGTSEGEQAAHRGPIVGALIVEQIESEIPREILAPRLDMVYEHSSRALSNALEHNSLFLMPVWRAIGHSKVMVQGRNLPRTALIGGGVLLLLLLGLFWWVDFDMGAKGALQPIERAEIFAPMGGEVEVVHKDNGEAVAAGEPLVTLRNPELAVKVQQLEGEYNAALEKLNGVRQQLTSDRQTMTQLEFKRLERDFSEMKIQVEYLKKQLDLVLKRQEQLVVRSPMSGRVITWDVKRTLQNRPVETGQVLMTVAAEDTDYRVELYMPERKMKHVTSYRESLKAGDPNADLRVDFILMTDPGVSHYGTVTEIHGATDAHEEHGNMVRIYVKPDEKIESPRPGASVSGNVYCGKAPALWAYLHEAWEQFEARVLFPWT